MLLDLPSEIHCRGLLGYLVLGSPLGVWVPDDFGTLIHADNDDRLRFIFDPIQAGTEDEHATWHELAAQQRARNSATPEPAPEPRPHSVCILQSGDTEAILPTAAELIVHREGSDPPAELFYRLNLRGEPGVYITRSDLLALVTGAAELLNLSVRPRRSAPKLSPLHEEAVPA